MEQNTNEPMGQIIPFPEEMGERPKEKERPDSRLRPIKILKSATGWLLFVMTLLFVLSNYRLFSPSSLKTIAGYLAAGFRGSEGAYSTVGFNGGSFLDAALLQNTLAYINNDGLYIEGVGDAMSLSLPLAFSNPALSAAGDYVLAYDRGGSKIVLTTREQVLLQTELSAPIVKASVYENGRSAFLLNEQGYRTSVLVLDEKGKTLWSLQTAAYYAIDACLLEDGKTLAVLGFAADGAAVSTRVHWFRLDRQEQQAEGVLGDTVGFALCGLPRGRVAVLSENGLSLAAQDGTVTELLGVASGDLLCFDGASDGLAVAVRSYEGNARAALYTLREDGALQGPQALSREPVSLAISIGGVCALSGDAAEVLNTSLQPYWHNTDAAGARRIFLQQDGTFYALFSQNARVFSKKSAASKEGAYAG